MREDFLKPSTVYGLLTLVMGLGACDICLFIRSVHRDALIAQLQYENHIISVAPAPGQSVPLIQGISLKDKKPLALRLTTSHAMILLIVRQDCSFCAENWRNWDTLFSSSDPKTPVYVITTDDELTAPYVAEHSLLQRSSVLLGVDPTVLQSLNVGSTPQTVYVVEGKIKHDWVGVLSKANLGEIRRTIAEN